VANEHRRGRFIEVSLLDESGSVAIGNPCGLSQAEVEILLSATLDLLNERKKAGAFLGERLDFRLSPRRRTLLRMARWLAEEGLDGRNA
jgi:hypothetical protein